jgi:type IV pilus assembly protein PilZ
MVSEATRRLRVSYPTSSGFLDAYFPNGALGGVLVETDADLPLGDEVALEIRFESGPKRPFHARVRVAWRRLRGKGSLRAGVGLEFLPTEREARDALLSFARGGEITVPDRDHERIPADLKVLVRTPQGARVDRSGDISEGGLFIRTPDMLPVGEALDMTIRPRFALRGIVLAGRVIWHRGGREPGMGVQFLFENEEQRRRVERLVSRLLEHRDLGTG